MAFEQQQAQGRRGVGRAAGEFFQPAFQRLRVAGGVVEDDQRGLAPAPFGEMLLGEKTRGLPARDETGVPARGAQFVAEFERKPGLAAAALADQHARGDGLRRMREGVQLGQRGFAAQEGDAPAVRREQVEFGRTGAEAKMTGERRMRPAEDDMDAVARVLDDDVAVTLDAGGLSIRHGFPLPGV